MKLYKVVKVDKILEQHLVSRNSYNFEEATTIKEKNNKDLKKQSGGRDLGYFKVMTLEEAYLLF